jgi:hypothetical protein
VSRIFRTFGLAERRLAPGHVVLILRQLGAKILTVKGAHDADVPPDLAQNVLERSGDGVSRRASPQRPFHQLGGSGKPEAKQLPITHALRQVLAGTDRREHSRVLPPWSRARD